MKNFSIGLIIFSILVFVVGGIGWVLNIVKFAQSDFKAPYKSEVVHGIGIVVPPVGMITGYMNLGK